MIVSKEDIAENDYNLNIARYVDTSEKEVEIDLVKVKNELAEIEIKEAEIDKKVKGFLAELGI